MLIINAIKPGFLIDFDFSTSLNNKTSNSLSHKKFTLILFFCPKNGGVVIVFFFSAFETPRTSETLKKGSN